MRFLSWVPSQPFSAPAGDRDAIFRVNQAFSDAWHATPDGAALDAAAQAAGMTVAAATGAVADAIKPDTRRLAAARRVAEQLTGADRAAALLVVDQLTAARAVTRSRVSAPLITARRQSAEAIAAWNASMAAFWAERAADFR